ncbi:unnamed protein product, partial [Mesorhabditis belari]|uniref:G protein-coupled receptor n=1 Tax=Mesorhabditis belari TaxID=2138241 RepID=A0AAF3F2W4_9BILA
MIVPEFQPIIVTATTIAAIFANGLLLYLILFHTKSHMKVYSRFMLSFALFNFIYPLICFFVSPLLYAWGNGFLMVPTGIIRDSVFLSFFGMLMYVSAYAQSLALLTFHFLYRFSLVCKIRFIKEMEAAHAWCWLIGLYLAMACGYCLNAYIFLMENPVIQNYFADAFQSDFGDNITAFVTVGAVYFLEDGSIYLRSWVGFLICMTVISSTFVLIVYCGRNIYHAILESAGSEKTKRAQMGIFRALVIQTLIPVACEYGPSGIILFCPIFGFSMDTTFVTIAFGIYSFVEPLATIYFVTDYRRVLIQKSSRALGRKKSLRTTVKVLTTTF